MASHTICCTCGHIIKLAHAVSGAKTVCSRCQKVWTVPEVQNSAPAPAARRPVIVRKQSSPVAAIVVVVILAAAVGGGAYLFSQGQSEEPPAPVAKSPPAPLPVPEPPLRAPRVDPAPAASLPPPPPPPPTPPPPPPPPPAPPRETLANPSLQAEVDLLIYRINTTAMTAWVLEFRGKKAETASLYEAMKTAIADLDRIRARLKADGLARFVPDHFLPGDRPTHLDKHDFAKLGADGSEKILVRFLGGLKAGSRARIAVRRGDDFAEVEVLYHQRPKELFSIIQVAGIIPGQGGSDSPESPDAPPVAVEPPTKKIPDALKILTDALLRRPAADREHAATILREAYAAGRAPAVLFVAANYLAYSDEALGIESAGAEEVQAYFNSVKFVEMESFDKPRHLAALADLKARIPSVKSKSPQAAELLLRFAAAHAADSGAAEGDVQKAAEGLGLRRTADDKRWGSALEVQKADLVAEILAGRPKDVWRRFDDTYRHHADFGIRLLGVWLLSMETFERNQGGFDRLGAGYKFISKNDSGDRAAHVEALLAGLEAAAKCTKCTGGNIPCPKCGGDSKIDVKCQRCEGKGTFEKGGGTVMCRECLGKGVHKDVDCNCGRTSGKVQCTDCKGKMWAPQVEAAITKIATLTECAACKGMGLPPVGIALSCPSCFGLGKTLVPSADPKKTLK